MTALGCGMKRLCCFSLLAMMLLSHGARAETIPAKGGVDGRIRTAAYDGAEVYKLRGFVGYQIDLEFEPGETFVGLGAGDMEGLAFVGQENHLFLKPKAAKVATNITVLTNRRHYHIDYSAASQRPIEDDAVYSLRFIYPQTPAKANAEAAAKLLDSQLENASSRRPQNIDYWYCGEPTLKPFAASDDGVHTRLTFSTNGDLPAIFVRNDDDSESLLNFSVDAGEIVIHRVARRFVLRRGKLVGCIVNGAYAGGGKRLESGTVAPEVERRVQGGVP
jgi:type IV secretion system protein VirB9